MTDKPFYTKDNFTVTIDSKPAPVFVSRPVLTQPPVQPPTQSVSGKYDLQVRWLIRLCRRHSLFTKELAVLYEPLPIVNPGMVRSGAGTRF